MPDDANAAIAELWSEYKANDTRDARERLIIHYAPLVKFVAGRVAAGLPQSIEQSDLVSYGIFGLIDAIDKFDPGRGFKFETYAISRIKGAIIDELRSIDWVPRSVRAKARSIERAISKLENELKRSPEDAEVAAELDMSEGELAGVLSQISFTGLVALDDLLAASGSDRSTVTTVADPLRSLELAARRSSSATSPVNEICDSVCASSSLVISSSAATSPSSGLRLSSFSSLEKARSIARAFARTERGTQSIERSSSMIAPLMREIAYVSNLKPRPGSNLSIASMSPKMP